MNILCDTCSVLMLIRIAPSMFCDERYECVTIQEVFKEIFQTQKFKAKYPWRKRYKDKIKVLGTSHVKKGDFELHLTTIKNITNTGITNNRTGHFFNLSHIDQVVVACAIAHNLKLTTVDSDLKDFIVQEFSGETISPLCIINDWLENELIEWGDGLQTIIDDWDKCNEAPQPKNEIRRFENLTGFKYTGPIEKRRSK